ncbi:MAG: class I SAM-dependent methyltransferase [Oscillospiraceae bacterium]|nr:class I SAM-dependent methyltransferase [Oscillospiraceae bacterium]
MKSHSGKAKNYDIGRAEYPTEFFDFLYGEFGIKTTDVIADIGCGTGRVTKHFLERGNKVLAIEYDADMLKIADHKFTEYPNYISICTPAEDTTVETGTVDYIICGTSYCWFDRTRAVPEFRRISRDNGNVLITHIYVGINDYEEDIEKVNEKYRQPVLSAKPNMSPPFPVGKFTEKNVEYTESGSYSKFLNTWLSMSFAPAEGHALYKPFCDEVSAVFKKYETGGIIKTLLRLHCFIGKAEDLIIL